MKQDEHLFFQLPTLVWKSLVHSKNHPKIPRRRNKVQMLDMNQGKYFSISKSARDEQKVNYSEWYLKSNGQIKLKSSPAPQFRSFHSTRADVSAISIAVMSRTATKRQKPKYEKAISAAHTRTSSRRCARCLQWLRDGCTKGVNWMKNNLHHRHTTKATLLCWMAPHI